MNGYEREYIDQAKVEGGAGCAFIGCLVLIITSIILITAKFI